MNKFLILLSIIVLLLIAFTAAMFYLNDPEKNCIEVGGEWNEIREICNLGMTEVDPPAGLERVPDNESGV